KLPTQLSLRKSEFAKIQFYFGSTYHLFQIVCPIDREQGETVRFDDVGEIVRGNNTAGAGHILRNDIRMAGQVFAQISGDKASVAPPGEVEIIMVTVLLS